MVEYALVLLIAFTTLYAIMEFGRFIFSYNILAGATREAARYAIVHGSKSSSPATSADIQTKVRSWSIGLESSNIAVTTTWSPSNAPGSSVQITSSYPLSPITTLVIKNPITLSSGSNMVISQ